MLYKINKYYVMKYKNQYYLINENILDAFLVKIDMIITEIVHDIKLLGV